jgi:alkylation response protein AidB-like acyl-CoA dehydrogenase
LASAYIQLKIIEFMDLQFQTMLNSGKIPGPETSLKKLFHAKQINDVTQTGLLIEGAAGLLFGEHDEDQLWVHEALNAPLFRIAGGTDEVQRNILSERVLGLPGEPKVDAGLSFREAQRQRQ